MSPSAAMEPVMPTRMVVTRPSIIPTMRRVSGRSAQRWPVERKRAVSVRAAIRSRVLPRWMESRTMRPVDWLTVT